MSYEFKVVDHHMLPGKQAVECWRDGVLAAVIYPHEDGIRIISKYMGEIYKEPQNAFLPEVPSAIVSLVF